MKNLIAIFSGLIIGLMAGLIGVGGGAATVRMLTDEVGPCKCGRNRF
ncbi:MAG TPA: hypothetical protein PKV21_06770 [bacterium]|nr:hypothetical protein [bacterium]HOM27192.1 hypothetical protein [bacterium]